MEGDEGGIFSKAPDQKPLLLLGIKISKTQPARLKYKI